MPTTHASTATALIADDDAFFRMALSAILTARLGVREVLEAGSLDEAVERLSAHPEVTFALFDLAMPGMDSAASLRGVRDCFPKIKVAVVSGSQRRGDILAALEAGAHGYVPKSLGVVELPNALRRIMDGAIFVPPSLAELPAAEKPAAEPGAGPACPEGLTPRQRDVLELLVRGLSNKEIARTLDIGEGTVKVHMAALFRGLGVSTRAAAAAVGARLLEAAPAR
ncbi:response regulator transcription factor [Alsobacter sp. SYSU M60028]|uniref:Response regulator transcription factor n=1 Tax=Alsobacter ponti TaxID=2962936 RepID=A0ABT1L703_9HYPH|nr:response regulator transcription factor [Alsobacter ponti]MCP8937231.1 response regulator transcription factor [Alsobacter ponti]